MGPEFRHYRLIRLGTPVNREEPPACPLPDLITAHLLHVDSVQTNNITPIWISFGGKKGYSQV